MRPLLTGFVEFAERRHPDLRENLEELLRRAGDKPDLEAFLTVVNLAIEAPRGLPQQVAADQQVHEWTKAASRIRAYLLSYIVEMCEQFDRDQAVRLFAPLVVGGVARGVRFCTTNYDRVVEWVAEVEGANLADGFSVDSGEIPAWTGEFPVGQAPLLKVHGSVTWYIEDDRQFLRLDRGYPLPGAEFHLSHGEKVLDPLMIVPTLEKEALHEPYSGLLLKFSEVLASTDLLVVIGSSLRDSHIRSTIEFNRDQVVVLIVGPDASGTLPLLPRNRTVALTASAAGFCETSVPSMWGMVDEALGSPADIYHRLETFAATEAKRIAEISALTNDQRRALQVLMRDGADDSELVGALTTLRGVSHSEVEAVACRLLTANDPDLRSTAAGTLGTSASPTAVANLLEVATGDPSPIVRLEASLAIALIGGEVGRVALKERGARRPDDDYIVAALKEMVAHEASGSADS